MAKRGPLFFFFFAVSPCCGLTARGRGSDSLWHLQLVLAIWQAAMSVMHRLCLCSHDIFRTQYVHRSRQSLGVFVRLHIKTFF